MAGGGGCRARVSPPCLGGFICEMPRPQLAAAAAEAGRVRVPLGSPGDNDDDDDELITF